MGFIRILYSILAIHLFVACGVFTEPVKAPEEAAREQTLELKLIEGKFQALDGSEVDLAANPEKSQIVMFVSETCSICLKETQALVQELNTNGEPENIEFFSIMVGSFPEDAQYWSESLNVSWITGTDAGDALFRNYCPEALTPCLLLRNAETQEITKLIGEHSLSEWQQYTAEWSY